MPATQPDKINILLIVTPKFNLSASVGFLDPFRAANYLEGRSKFGWVVASEDGGSCLASNGLNLETTSLAEVQSTPFDMVVVSSSWSPEGNKSSRLRAALWRWYKAGSALGGLDTGAFILAEAGMLDGRRATVHYEHLDAFSELYPNIKASEDICVFDERVMTCCGGVASVDFALAIMRETHGDALANSVARYIFKSRVRPPETRQNSELSEPLGRKVPQIIKNAIDTMEANLETPLSIPEICAAVGISQRQLNRLFVRFVGHSPSLYYRDIRLDRARGLVTQTELALSQVALASGFASQVHFSRAYHDRFGLPPSRDRIEGRVPFEFRAWPMYRKI